MSVRVELFGIAGQRAGVAVTTAEGTCLGEVLAHLAVRFPELANTCFDRGRLRPGYLAAVGGGPFVSDPDTQLRPGDTLLILPSDSGG